MREVLRAGLGGALVIAAAVCAGCSTAPLPDDDVITGSITPRPVVARAPQGAAPQGVAASDWSAATVALDQALASSEADISVPWENRDTGAHGTATPIGPRRAGGCRDFMIAVVDGKVADRWIHGEACRGRAGTVLTQVRVLGRA
ncbi:RT0821/Lpp0805 family surface protein [Xanthobacter sp. V4C-4]|uniref:RT0821/Lpp0805 family surface protein n=1 Tax=Xanthobacter cornucopiae TaxID=3119924 RepID=UPI0037262D13